MLLQECQISLYLGLPDGKERDEIFPLATKALDCGKPYGFARSQRRYFARIANPCSYVLQQADIAQFLSKFYLEQADMEKARKYLEDCIEHCTHCWRYNETIKNLNYIKKDEKWWYEPRYEKAQQ